MPLMKQPVYVSLTEGLNTKSDDKFMLPGEVVLLENGVYKKDGRIDKKYGFSNLSQDTITAGTINSAKGLYSQANELLLESGNSMYSYSPTSSKWVSKGTFIRSSVQTTQVTRNSDEQTDLQFATLSNIRVYAWKDSRGGVRYSVQDVQTGLNYVSDTEVSATGARPRIVTSNGKFFIFYYITTTLRYKSVDIATPTTLSSETSLISDVHATIKSFDLVSIGSSTSTNIYLLYVDTSGDVVTKKYNYDISSTVATDTFTATDVDNEVALVVSTVSGTSYLHTAWYSSTGSGIRIRIIDTSFAEILAETLAVSTVATLITGAQIASSSHNVQWFLSPVYDSAALNANLVQSGIIGTGGIDTAFATTYFGYRLATKAFSLNSAVFVGISFCAHPQGTLFVVDKDKNILAKVAPGETGLGDDLVVLGSIETTATTVLAAFNKLGEFKVEGNIGRTLQGYTLAMLSTSPTVSASTAVLNGILYTAAGTLYAYDGISYFEDGFAHYPVLNSSSFGTSGSLVEGTYQFAEVYEWLDNQGNLQRSAPSEILSHTFAGGVTNGSALINVMPLSLSSKKSGTRSDIRIVLYMTKLNDGVFYRVEDKANGSTNNVAFTVTAAPAGTTEILYVQGGALENIQAPSCDIVINHGNRLVIAGLEDGSVSRVSKPARQNEAPGFNEGLEIRLSSEGGRITAAASMDDKLIYFKRKTIYWCTGEGPDALGSGSFTEPQIIPSAVGAIDQNGVISTPIGVLFKSDKGFYLLSRNLEVSQFGDKVIDFNSNTISSAVVIPDADEIRLCTTDGNIIVFNYHYNKWSVLKNLASVGSVIWDNKHVLVTASGLVKYEDSSTYLDNGSFVQLKLKTGWLNVGEVAGLQRIYEAAVVGDFNTSHKVNLKISYDNDDSTTEDHLLAVTADPKDYVYKCAHGRQKCNSIQYTVHDSAPDSGTGTGRGFSISGLKLMAGVKNKLSNTPATRRF